MIPSCPWNSLWYPVILLRYSPKSFLLPTIVLVLLKVSIARVQPVKICRILALEPKQSDPMT